MKKLAVLFLLMCNYQVSANTHPFYGGEAVYWARSILHLDVIDILPPLRKVRPLNAIGGILTKQNSVYKIFPNPTNDFVSIKSNNDIYHNIYANIFDGTGRLLLTKTLLEKDTKINLKDFCGGFYQIKIFEGDAIKQTEKLIIIK
nr:T9SS type A sorting domain-containing protein [Bacteroidota bacterium]